MLDSLDERVPAIVLMDLALSGMPGIQLARHLRLNHTTRMLPIIAISEDEAVSREALLAGIDAVVETDIPSDLLILRINGLLRGAQTATQAALRERFRRPTVAIATTSNQPPCFLHRLREEGLDVLMLDANALASPDFWFPGVDCLIVNLASADYDGLALCRMFDRLRHRTFLASQTPARLIGFAEGTGVSAADAYRAGVDDFLTDVLKDMGLFMLHVRVQLRRKVLLDENLRSEAERMAREVAMEGARAKTVLADALEHANDELASANRKLIEAQTKLVQSAKMASLGELVAGIAHEFNNPLAFVLAHEDTVSRLLEGAMIALEAGDTAAVLLALEKGRERLAATTLGLGRMRDLVSSLRRFTRLDQGAFENVDMPDAIETVISLLAPKLVDRVEVRKDFQAPPVLRCQMALVHQVVMNVISNAADALATVPGNDNRQPLIRIATRLEETLQGEGQDYVIVISDNGPGIPPLMRERVFEPFFTTKPVGEGTGLGLATAYGIVQAHGGVIDVSSGEEGGACFTIAVPFEHETRQRDEELSRPASGLISAAGNMI